MAIKPISPLQPLGQPALGGFDQPPQQSLGDLSPLGGAPQISGVMPGIQPIAPIQPFGQNPLRLDQKNRRRRPRPQSLESTLAGLYPEQEQESMLSKIGYGLLSGVGVASAILDTPGSIIKASVVGKNPLKSVFNLDERTTGRDVLTAWGITKPNDPDEWEVADFMGFAMDVALDPLMLVTGPGGAITKKGIAAGLLKGGTKTKIAGHLATPLRMAEEISKGQRGLIGFKVPFGKQLGAIGTGSRAAKGFESVAYSAPVRRMRQVFGTIKGAAYANTAGEMKAIDTGYNTLLDTTAELVDRHYQLELMMPSVTEPWNKYLKSYFRENPDELESVIGTLRDRPKLNAKSLEDAGLLDDTGKLKSNITDQQVIDASKSTPEQAIEEMTDQDFLRAMIEAKKYRLPDVDDPAFEAARDALVMKTGATSSLRGILNADSVDKLSAKLSLEPKTIFEAAEKFDDYASKVGDFVDEARNLAANAGLPEPMLQDMLIGYYPRGVDEIWKPLFDARKGGRKLFGKSYPTALAASFNRARRDMLRDIPGGTRSINAMSRDPVLSARATMVKNSKGNFVPDVPWKKLPMEERVARAEYIQKNYEFPLRGARMSPEAGPYSTVEQGAGEIESTFRTLDDISNMAGNEVTAEQFAFAEDNKMMDELLGWLHELPVTNADERRKMYDLGVFSRDVMADGLNYARQAAKAHGAISTVNEMIAQGATTDPIGPSVKSIITNTPENGGLGLTDSAIEVIDSRLRELGKDGTSQTMYLPEDAFPSIRKVVQLQVDDKLADKALGWFDSFHGAFKASVTVPFPAFHTRNRISGYWQNLVSAFDLKNPAKIARAMSGAKSALNGNTVTLGDDVIEGGGDLIELAKRWKVLEDSDLRLPTMTEGLSGDKISPSELGSVAWNPLSGAARARQRSAIKAADEELQVARAAGESTLGPLAKKYTRRIFTTGEDTMRYVESQNRLEHFYARLMDGWTPAAAAESVTKNHFRYSDLAHSHWIQSKVLRRSFSFYPWLRFNTARQFGDLVNSPGGITAQTVRALNSASQGDPEGTFIPPWLRERITMPINSSVLGLFGPSEDDKYQRYLTASGFIPVEDALNKFPFLAMPGALPKPQWKRIIQKMVSMSRPEFQMLAEGASGVQMWTGRQKSQLFQTPTRSERVNDLIAHSPIARLASTAKSMMPSIIGEPLEMATGINFYDPRKGVGEKVINFAIGGINFTDIDKERGLTVEGRRLLEDVMSPINEVRTFSRMTVRPEDVGNLKPDELRLWSLYNYLLARSRKSMAADKRNKR